MGYIHQILRSSNSVFPSTKRWVRGPYAPQIPGIAKIRLTPPLTHPPPPPFWQCQDFGCISTPNPPLKDLTFCNSAFRDGKPFQNLPKYRHCLDGGKGGWGGLTLAWIFMKDLSTCTEGNYLPLSCLIIIP